MQAAERGKLCSPNIINAAMTWHLQQHQNQSDCSSSFKGGDWRITSPLSNKDSSHMSSSVHTKPSLPEPYSHHVKVVEIYHRQETSKNKVFVLQILPATRHHSSSHHLQGGPRDPQSHPSGPIPH